MLPERGEDWGCTDVRSVSPGRKIGGRRGWKAHKSWADGTGCPYPALNPPSRRSGSPSARARKLWFVHRATSVDRHRWRIGGQAKRGIRSDLLDVDIEVVLGTIPDESDLVAVRRETRGDLPAGRACEGNCRFQCDGDRRGCSYPLPGRQTRKHYHQGSGNPKVAATRRHSSKLAVPEWPAPPAHQGFPVGR